MGSESLHTFVGDWCPHPEWWSSPDANATEDEVTALVGAFVRALKPLVCVETGAYHGHTTQAIGSALALNDNGGHLWTVEIDPVHVEEVSAVTRDLPVTVVEGNALTWDAPADIEFAWIDALLEGRSAEFEHIAPLLTDGALVGFHDTGPQFDGRGEVRANIGRVMEGRDAQILDLRTPRGVTFVRVGGGRDLSSGS